jgi:hypothetical protein
VPHGFEHVIRESGDIVLSRAALEQLCEMTKDKSKYVRYNAELSIARVKDHFAFGTPFKDKTVFELVTQFRTSWSYDWEIEVARRIWKETGLQPPSLERYFSTVGWKTPCCAFELDINFKFYERNPTQPTISWLGQPRVSWLRSSWESLDKRIGIPCGKCGRHRRPDWRSLLKRARANAKELPNFSTSNQG